MRFFVQFVEFVSGRRSYIVLIGRLCDICLNTLAWIDDESDDSSDGFNEDIEQVPHDYCVGVFNTEVGRDVGNECLQTVHRTAGPCPHSGV